MTTITHVDPARVGEDDTAPLIQAIGLRRSYGDFEAVKGVDVSVPRGEAFGFLGPNGAGKSSTMRMLATVSAPSSGTLRILGLDPQRHGSKIRARIGVVPQDDTLDSELTVLENIVIFGRYFGLPWRESRARAAELLAFAQLEDRVDAKVGQLSGGMRRRLAIARALVNRPELILLDEPTTGLDPQARHVLWERLHQLKREGVTLVLTTHYMDEAEQLCDRLVIMDGGRIVAEGSPRHLIATTVEREVLEVRHGGDDQIRSVVIAALPQHAASNPETVEELPERLLVPTDDADGLAELLVRHQVAVHRLYPRRATLEDVFLKLTGRALTD